MITAIIAFFKSLPILDKWFTDLLEAYILTKIADVKKDNVSIIEERAIMLKKISESKNTNEKAILFYTYNRIK